MRDIGKNIKHFRVKMNMTQDVLAERLFVTRQTVSNYETGKSRPDVDMLVKISEVLGTDIQQLIYGPEPKLPNRSVIRLCAGGGLMALVGMLWLVLNPVAQKYRWSHFDIGLSFMIYSVIRPLFFILLGWTTAHVLSMALKRKPIICRWARCAGALLMILLVIWFMLAVWDCAALIVNEWQYSNYLRGEWVQTEVEYDGVKTTSAAWSMLPPQVPVWVQWLHQKPLFLMQGKPALFTGLAILLGAALWLLGIPQSKKEKETPVL